MVLKNSTPLSSPDASDGEPAAKEKTSVARYILGIVSGIILTPLIFIPLAMMIAEPGENIGLLSLFTFFLAAVPQILMRIIARRDDMLVMILGIICNTGGIFLYLHTSGMEGMDVPVYDYAFNLVTAFVMSLCAACFCKEYNP